MTLAKYPRRWIAVSMKGSVETITRESHEQLVNKHVSLTSSAPEPLSLQSSSR